MNRHLPPPEPVPVTFEPGSPVTEHMDLVEQDDHTAMGACGRLCPRPDAFPEARQGGLRAVTRRVESRRTGLPGELQEERGLPHLARPGQELDPSRRSFGQALQKEASAVLVVHRESIIE
jgi:hypothetical protein